MKVNIYQSREVNYNGGPVVTIPVVSDRITSWDATDEIIRNPIKTKDLEVKRSEIDGLEFAYTVDRNLEQVMSRSRLEAEYYADCRVSEAEQEAYESKVRMFKAIERANEALRTLGELPINDFDFGSDSKPEPFRMAQDMHELTSYAISERFVYLDEFIHGADSNGYYTLVEIQSGTFKEVVTLEVFNEYYDTSKNTTGGKAGIVAVMRDKCKFKD